MVIVGSNRAILLVNSRMEKMFGYTEKTSLFGAEFSEQTLA